MKVRLLVILLTFYVMGFGDARGSFVGIAKEVFGISASQGALIPFCGAMAFGLLAVPAGLLATRRGKKFVMLLGLLITAAGHALPMLLLERYSHLVAAIFVIGAGMTCLLVAGNPMLREATGPDRFARDLTFAQFIKSLGSITGPYLIALIVTLGWTWRELFPVFAVAALVVFVALALVRVPETIQVEPATLGDMVRILRARTIQIKLLGIFLFVGTEMGHEHLGGHAHVAQPRIAIFLLLLCRRPTAGYHPAKGHRKPPATEIRLSAERMGSASRRGPPAPAAGRWLPDNRARPSDPSPAAATCRAGRSSIATNPPIAGGSCPAGPRA